MPKKEWEERGGEGWKRKLFQLLRRRYTNKWLFWMAVSNIIYEMVRVVGVIFKIVDGVTERVR